MASQPGHGGRLADCHATIGRLIAGLNVHMFPQGQGTHEAVVYAADTIPVDVFLQPAPTRATPGSGVAPAAAPALTVFRFFLAHAGMFAPRAGTDPGPRARLGGRLPFTRDCAARTSPKLACFPLCPQRYCPPCCHFGPALERTLRVAKLQPVKSTSLS